MTRSQDTAAACWGLRRVAAREASTIGAAQGAGAACQAALPCTRQGRANLRSSSSAHWPTRPGGTRIRVRAARRRRHSSLRIRPASMVLPKPTSSASRARPRMRRRTVIAASSWCGNGVKRRCGGDSRVSKPGRSQTSVAAATSAACGAAASLPARMGCSNRSQPAGAVTGQPTAPPCALSTAHGPRSRTARSAAGVRRPGGRRVRVDPRACPTARRSRPSPRTRATPERPGAATHRRRGGAGPDPPRSRKTTSQDSLWGRMMCVTAVWAPSTADSRRWSAPVPVSPATETVRRSSGSSPDPPD